MFTGHLYIFFWKISIQIVCPFFFFFFAILPNLLILVSWPGIEPRPSSVKVQSPNLWTAREFPLFFFFFHATFLITELLLITEFSVYSQYKSYVISMLCKYFFFSQRPAFCFLTVSFEEQKVFNFVEADLINWFVPSVSLQLICLM